MRDPSLFPRRGRDPRLRAQGGGALGRSRLDHPGAGAAGPRGRVRARGSGSRHLLRPAGDVHRSRRGGRRHRGARVRPRGAHRDRRLRPVRRGLGTRRQCAGLDEPRRPGHPAARGVFSRRGERRRALRCDRRRRPRILRRPVPPGGRPYPGRRGAAAELHPHYRRLRRRLDHGRLSRPGDRAGTRPGRGRARGLRPVGRRRQRGHGRSAPRSAGRSVLLRLRGYRADARGRDGGGGRAVPRPLQHSAARRRREATLPRRARGGDRSGTEAQADRSRVH